MPLFEEKLINPLAVRFTQDHIRTTFRDGRPVDPTINEIKTLPGVGEYDVLLSAPFPSIEIIRWKPPNHRGGSDDQAEHWYTLDNRRLYCLQRAAAALLPKRAAAVVEILYADSGHIHRKYDSESFGRAVTISHSCKQAALWCWNWQEILNKTGSVAAMYIVHQAKQAALVDDRKQTVAALQDASPTTAALPSATAPSGAATDLNETLRRAEEHCRAQAAAAVAPAAPADTAQDILRRAEAHCAAQEAAATGTAEARKAVATLPRTLRSKVPEEVEECESTPTTASEGGSWTGVSGSSSSTGSPRSDRSSKKCLTQSATTENLMGQLRKTLEAGAWTGKKGESYSFHFVDDATWKCVRTDGASTRNYTLWYDAEWEVVWWGADQAFFASAAPILEATGDVPAVHWHASADWDAAKPKVRFAWTRAPQATKAKSKTSAKVAASKPAAPAAAAACKAKSKTSAKVAASKPAAPAAAAACKVNAKECKWVVKA